MKKLFLSLAFCCVFALWCPATNAAESDFNGDIGNVVDQLTGTLWQQSTQTEKLSFLLGVETAITVEHFVNDIAQERAQKTGKKRVSTLSPFERGWMTVFKNTPRSTIARKVDEWYAAHPEGLERPVMGVIWYEIIAPQWSGNS
ncbi:MAG: hypothetical protein J5861_02335 [Desulfovibrio sp.]|nr:hypothetical protein [Desulfovibrio sp.]